MNPERRIGRTVALVWLVGLGGFFAAWFWFRDPARALGPDALVIRAANALRRLTYDDPALQTRIAISRFALLYTFACAGVLAFSRRHAVRDAVTRFFSYACHPMNLAIFRIVVFIEVYRLAWTDLVARTAAQPNDLQFPPYTGIPDIGPLAHFSYWPVNPITAGQVTVLVEAMKIAAIAGAIGLFTRVSAAVTACLLFAGWGTMQWYGKVDHYHHLLWFLLIFAVSRAGDALSLDSLIDSFRRGRRGDSAPRVKSVEYGTPIRVCMLLMGVIYFFPGFHKMWTSGFDWFLSEYPTNQLHMKWHQLGGWLPALRVDRYPLLMSLGAVGTVLFEMSFVFMIFARRTRWIAAVVGVTFHTSLNLVARYGFQELRNCYVLFVDWKRGFRWLGKRLYPRDLVLSGAPAGFAGGLLGWARSFDLFDALRWSNERTADAFEATLADRPLTGPEAWRAMLLRVPVLWPLLPFAAAIDRAAARVEAGRDSAAATIEADADSAAAATIDSGRDRGVAIRPASRGPARALVLAPIVLGGLLFLSAAWAGLKRHQEGWPIASYPLFDGLTPPYYRTLAITVVTAGGDEREIEPDALTEVMGTRWVFEIRSVLDEWDAEVRRERLAHVWEVISEHESVEDARSLRFHQVRLLTQPERRGERTGEPELLLEMDL